MVGVFDAVRRVLRDDGCCVVNLGDSYACKPVGRFNGGSALLDGRDLTGHGVSTVNKATLSIPEGNRVGIPERFALAMQQAGWIWRDTVIWHKKSPMPASLDGWRWERCRVKIKAGEYKKYSTADNPDVARPDDFTRTSPWATWSDCPGCPKCQKHGGYVLRRGSLRSTTAHEYLYIFAKTDTYFGDRDGWATPAKTATLIRNQYTRVLDDPDEQFAVAHDHEFNGATANFRSVYTCGPEPLKHKHYAAYPAKLIEPFIKAFTPERCCAKCGAGWARVVNKSRSFESGSGKSGNDPAGKNGEHMQGGGETGDIRRGPCLSSSTIGWRPTCECGDEATRPAVVLDPFGGSGTSAIAAKLLGRDAILCELNPEYVQIMHERFSETAPLLLNANRGAA